MREASAVVFLLLALLSSEAVAASAATTATAASRTASQKAATPTGCTIDLIDDVPDKEPLLLQQSCSGRSCTWKLPEGDEEHLYFETGEEILVACTNNNNKLENLPQSPKSIVAKCAGKENDVFKVENREYSIKDLECSRTSKGEILNKNTPCGPRNATLLQLGFFVRDEWFPLIDVCHVKSRSDTLYTQHVLQGESAKKRRGGRRPTFEEGGEFYQGFSANDAYKNAAKTLQTVSGYSTFPSSVSTSIDRGHLSPDADFLLAPYRYSTYFYVNTVPMWGAVNRGNWAILEEKLRKFAKNTEVDLQIVTGVFRVMELTDKWGNQKEFFLYTTPTRKQMPVPKFVWKLVYDEESKQGIVFVIVNDPFKKSVDPSDILCPNICKESGWHDNRWRTFAKGFLYCCEVNQLKKFVPYVPKYDVRSILRANN